jgi:hypothetical protein
MTAGSPLRENLHHSTGHQAGTGILIAFQLQLRPLEKAVFFLLPGIVIVRLMMLGGDANPRL